MSTKKLADLVAELDEATEALKSAQQSEQIARQHTTSARNRVNNLQKQIDAEVSERRKAAPWDTDWHSRHRAKAATDTAYD
jgi:hypothetical protein